MEAADACLALVSCPPERAEALARGLVEQRLAACVNILPAVQSVYRWQGAVQSDREALLVIKTATARIEDLRKAVLAVHPYELPEFIVVKLSDAHPPYLQWLLDSSH